ALWPDLIKDIYDCAQDDPEFAKNFDIIYAEGLEIKVTDDAPTMIKKKPKSRLPAPIKEQIQPDGTLRLALDELKKLSQDEFGKINTGIVQLREQLVAIDKKQQVLDRLCPNAPEERELERAKAAAGERAVCVAVGANTARQYLQAGLLDEIQLHVAPVIQGDGLRLLEGLSATPIKLERSRVIEAPLTTHLRFRVSK
ncbi:MAG: dihydrofolate reductase family protein, partial [Pleurocapsa sp. SU_196_0]|nr:dihydrofolate reductase family protein [Pleurocapsa sp. SU_196_0]